MAQKHLESDKFFENNVENIFVTVFILRVFSKVSHNMFFRHTNAEFVNNPG